MTKEAAFENACKVYLYTLGMGDLRNYGRVNGISRPTAKSKDLLIEEIVAVLSGRAEPKPISKQGAPVKNAEVSEKIYQRIHEIRQEFFPEGKTNETPAAQPAPLSTPKEGVSEGKSIKGMLPRLQQMPVFFRNQYIRMTEMHMRSVRLSDGVGRRDYRFLSEEEAWGQCYFDGEYWLVVPLTYSLAVQKVFLDEETVAKKGLCEGDIVSGPVEKDGDDFYMIAVWTINGARTASAGNIPAFDSLQRVRGGGQLLLAQTADERNTTTKCIDWFTPIPRGGSFAIYAPPKTGKTRLASAVVERLVKRDNTEIYALLSDEAELSSAEYARHLLAENIAYATDEMDGLQAFYAIELMATRAKRQAACGKNILLVIDSLTALAKLLNDSDMTTGRGTISHGLEVKTVELLQHYLSTACAIENGGSISLLCTVQIGTGNPLDEVLAKQLSKTFYRRIYLDERLAFEGIYPAINLRATTQEKHAAILNADLCMRLSELSPKEALQLVEGSDSVAALTDKLAE